MNMMKFTKILTCALLALSLFCCSACGEDTTGDQSSDSNSDGSKPVSAGDKTAQKTAEEFFDEFFTLLNDGKFSEYTEYYELSAEEKEAMAANLEAAKSIFEIHYDVESIEAKEAEDVILADVVYVQSTRLIDSGDINMIRSQVSYALKQYDGVWKISTYMTGESTLLAEGDANAETSAE